MSKYYQGKQFIESDSPKLEASCLQDLEIVEQLDQIIKLPDNGHIPNFKYIDHRISLTWPSPPQQATLPAPTNAPIERTAIVNHLHKDDDLAGDGINANQELELDYTVGNYQGYLNDMQENLRSTPNRILQAPRQKKTKRINFQTRMTRDLVGSAYQFMLSRGYTTCETYDLFIGSDPIGKRKGRKCIKRNQIKEHYANVSVLITITTDNGEAARFMRDFRDFCKYFYESSSVEFKQVLEHIAMIKDELALWERAWKRPNSCVRILYEGSSKDKPRRIASDWVRNVKKFLKGEVEETAVPQAREEAGQSGSAEQQVGNLDERSNGAQEISSPIENISIYLDLELASGPRDLNKEWKDRYTRNE